MDLTVIPISETEVEGAKVIGRDLPKFPTIILCISRRCLSLRQVWFWAEENHDRTTHLLASPVTMKTSH